MLSLKKTILLLVFASIAILLIPNLNHQPINHILGTQTDLTSSTIISLTNLQRTQASLPPLMPHSSLNIAAKLKAQHMVNNHYFNHNIDQSNPTWEYITQEGYQYSNAGENLARHYTDASTLINAWMNSPPHRTNILSPDYQHIGIGIAYDNDTAVVVQLFASPPPSNMAYEPIEQNTPVLFNNPINKNIILLFTFIVFILIITIFIKSNHPYKKKSKSKTPKRSHWRT